MVAQQGTSRYGLEVGTPALGSAGPITFSPDGVLFVADNAAAAVLAFDLGDDDTGGAPGEIENLDSVLAAYLGCPREDVSIRDVAVHPLSRALYLSVRRGNGDGATPVLIRIGEDGAPTDVLLEGLPFASAEIGDAPALDDERVHRRLCEPNEAADEELDVHGVHLRIKTEPLRTQTITDLLYEDGVLLVAGLSNEEFASTLRRVPFPFNGGAESTSLEIFHVSHGVWETHAPIKTFMSYGDGDGVLAAYTCTPVVRFSLTDLRNGEQAKGTTVAELGAMNSPIDMVSYRSDGEEYLLVSNLRHPLMKLRAADIDGQEALTTKTEPVGIPREELPQEGVGRLAVAGDRVLMLQSADDALHLRSQDLATL
jgi:hypothetical protein